MDRSMRMGTGGHERHAHRFRRDGALCWRTVLLHVCRARPAGRVEAERMHLAGAASRSMAWARPG
jgi:hypothetical protein